MTQSFLLILFTYGMKLYFFHNSFCFFAREMVLSVIFNYFSLLTVSQYCIVPNNGPYFLLNKLSDEGTTTCLQGGKFS